MGRTARIRNLNDTFRKAFVGGKVMLTQGVDALGDQDKAAVLTTVRGFEDFDEDNDPHHEHDFFSVAHNGVRYFAKIDYYAKDMHHRADDPADPNQTVRVLTIMRADEY